MASQVIGGQRWPDGTTVNVYLASSQTTPGGPPSGIVQASAVVEDGTVTFSGLEVKVQHVAWAAGVGVRFTTQPEIADDLTAARANMRTRMDAVEVKISSPLGGGGGLSALIAGPVTDESFLEATLREAQDGDEAVDTVSQRRYSRFGGLWSFTQLVLTVTSVTMEPILTNHPAGAQWAQPITYTFEEPVQAGQFVTGDWWVAPLGTDPVVISSMTPDYDQVNFLHGWQVNPSAQHITNPQSLSGIIGCQNFVAPPALPYTTAVNDSVIKVVSQPGVFRESDYPVQFAAVLTVLSGPPPAGSLRPPCSGTYKPLVNAADLDISMLASEPAVTGAPTYEWCLNRVKGFRNNWNPNPIDGPHYITADAVDGGDTWGGDLFLQDVQILAALQLDHLTSLQKRRVCMYLAQHALDQYAVGLQVAEGDTMWSGDGGQRHGFLTTIVWGAMTMGAGGQEIRDWLAEGFTSAIMFLETGLVYISDAPLANGMALWGEPDQFRQWINTGLLETIGIPTFEGQWWEQLMRPEGVVADPVNAPIFNGTSKDPYSLIDGTSDLGKSYQGPTSQQIGYLAAVMDLCPALKPLYPPVADSDNPLYYDTGEALYRYGQRWRAVGVWARPDDAAPKIDQMLTYGENYGAVDVEAETPGEYFTDPTFETDPLTSGRWPERHGYRGFGLRNTAFGDLFGETYGRKPFYGLTGTPTETFSGSGTVAPWDGGQLYHQYAFEDPPEEEPPLIQAGGKLVLSEAGYCSESTSVDYPADSIFQVRLPTVATVDYTFRVWVRVQSLHPLTAIGVGWDSVRHGWVVMEIVDDVFSEETLIIVPAAHSPYPTANTQIAVWLEGDELRLLYQPGGQGAFVLIAQRDGLAILDDGSVALESNDNGVAFDDFRTVETADYVIET